MSEPFIGQIVMVGFDHVPPNWMLCNGQILAIAQNQALFSLLGTTYGGNGTTTFALPDLRGRIPIHAGRHGFNEYHFGQPGGVESVALVPDQMPVHTHSVRAVDANADQPVPAGCTWAIEPTSQHPVYSDAHPDGWMNPGALATAGDGEPHSNLMPYLAINYIICVYGWFPPRG